MLQVLHVNGAEFKTPSLRDWGDLVMLCQVKPRRALVKIELSNTLSNKHHFWYVTYYILCDFLLRCCILVEQTGERTWGYRLSSSRYVSFTKLHLCHFRKMCQHILYVSLLLYFVRCVNIWNLRNIECSYVFFAHRLLCVSCT